MHNSQSTVTGLNATKLDNLLNIFVRLILITVLRSTLNIRIFMTLLPLLNALCCVVRKAIRFTIQSKNPTHKSLMNTYSGFVH